jgi:hypothetical protein
MIELGRQTERAGQLGFDADRTVGVDSASTWHAR